MQNWKKWVLGVAIIVAGVLAYLIIPWADNDPATSPDVGKAVQEVQRGVETIKGGQ